LQRRCNAQSTTCCNGRHTLQRRATRRVQRAATDLRRTSLVRRRQPRAMLAESVSHALIGARARGHTRTRTHSHARFVQLRWRQRSASFETPTTNGVRGSMLCPRCRWVHPCHFCTGTGLAPATYAPGRAVQGRHLFAIGGSDGRSDLNTVERCACARSGHARVRLCEYYGGGYVCACNACGRKCTRALLLVSAARCIRVRAYACVRAACESSLPLQV
jgi:hypothetical protein